MPCNMAVHEPSARIVGYEGKDHVPVGRKHSHITTRRVDVVERSAAVINPSPCTKDVEVVPVKVHWMWLGWCPVRNGLNDPERPLIRFWQVDEVHVSWVAGVLV